MSKVEELVNELGVKEIATLEGLKEAYAKTYALKTIALTGRTHQISMPDEVFSMLKELTRRLKRLGVRGKINVNDLTILLVLMGYSKISKIVKEAEGAKQG
jgi:hypothetical protein